jgi:hypothetical protein
MSGAYGAEFLLEIDWIYYSHITHLSIILIRMNKLIDIKVRVIEIKIKEFHYQFTVLQPYTTPI